MTGLPLISRSTLWLTEASLIALSLIVAYWAFGPLFSEVRATRGAIIERERTYEEYKARAQDFTKAQPALKELARQTGQLQAFFLTPQDVLPFLLALEANARAAGVQQELNLLSPPPAATKRESSTDHYLALAVNAEGRFPALMRYLGLIENMTYFLEFEDLQIITSKQTANERQSLKMTYRLSVAAAAPINPAIDRP